MTEIILMACIGLSNVVGSDQDDFKLCVKQMRKCIKPEKAVIFRTVEQDEILQRKISKKIDDCIYGYGPKENK